MAPHASNRKQDCLFVYTYVQVHACDANLISKQNYIGLYKYWLPLNNNKNS